MLIGEPYSLKDLRAGFPNSHTKVEFKGNSALCLTKVQSRYWIKEGIWNFIEMLHWKEKYSFGSSLKVRPKIKCHQDANLRYCFLQDKKLEGSLLGTAHYVPTVQTVGSIERFELICEGDCLFHEVTAAAPQARDPHKLVWARTDTASRKSPPGLSDRPSPTPQSTGSWNRPPASM